MRRLHRIPPDRAARRPLAGTATATIAALVTLASGALAVPSGTVGPAAETSAVPRGSAAVAHDASGIHGAIDTTDGGDVRAVTVEGATLTFPTPEDPGRPLMVLDDRLGERMRAMAARSPKWARALETLRQERFPVLVGSIVQVEEVVPEIERHRFDGAGAAWLFTDARDRPVAAAVTLNLPKLTIRNRITGGDAQHLRRMLELHLAHEIYGHVLPVVTSRDIDHPCADDPDPGAPPRVQRESCVMERESEILTDLGYAPRQTYHWDFWSERIERLGSGGSGDGGGSLRR